MISLLQSLYMYNNKCMWGKNLIVPFDIINQNNFKLEQNFTEPQ